MAECGHVFLSASELDTLSEQLVSEYLSLDPEHLLAACKAKVRNDTFHFYFQLEADIKLHAGLQKFCLTGSRL
jgi:hypothetical protein